MIGSVTPPAPRDYRPLLGRRHASARANQQKRSVLTEAQVLEARIYQARHPELKQVDIIYHLLCLWRHPVEAETVQQVLRNETFPHLQPAPWQIDPFVPALPARSYVTWLFLLLCVLMGGRMASPTVCASLLSTGRDIEGVSE